MKKLVKITFSILIYVCLIVSFVWAHTLTHSTGLGQVQAAPPRPGDDRPPRPKPSVPPVFPVPIDRDEERSDAYSIEGTITDATTDEPGTGLYVRINNTLVRTDSQGDYSLTGAGVQPGSYSVSLALPKGLKPVGAPQKVVLGYEKKVRVDLQYTPDALALQLDTARENVRQRWDVFKGAKQRFEEAERQWRQAQLELTRLEGESGIAEALLEQIAQEESVFYFPDQQVLLSPPPQTSLELIPSIQMPGGYFGVQVSSAKKGYWTVVQWQDPEGNWHNSDAWQGELDGNKQKLWWVAESDFGRGPFRWVIYESHEGVELVRSSPFYLPGGPSEAIMIEIRN